MKCLHCGYCCIHYDVMIVSNPAEGIRESNIEHKPTGVKCRHLAGERAGKYKCSIHNCPWYKDTPCFRHGQIERSKDDKCRIGVYILSKQ